MDNWQSIETAPKPEFGATDPSRYILGFVPETLEDPTDMQSCISVVWWEPKLGGGSWWCDGDFPVKPTHWMPLPAAPEHYKKEPSTDG